MSLARAIRRGAFLKARLGVNGIQNASRSLGRDGGEAGLDMGPPGKRRRLRGGLAEGVARARRLPMADCAVLTRAIRFVG